MLQRLCTPLISGRGLHFWWLLSTCVLLYIYNIYIYNVYITYIYIYDLSPLSTPIAKVSIVQELDLLLSLKTSAQDIVPPSHLRIVSGVGQCVFHG